MQVNIGLSGKFVPMLKENWNAENLNFSRHELFGQPNTINTLNNTFMYASVQNKYKINCNTAFINSMNNK